MKERARVSHGGITAISVSGYKSISRQQRIEIRPLTILAGANNSGKSSMLQPLLLLKQTLEDPGDPGPLRLPGPIVHFSAIEELLAQAPGQPATRSFEVGLEFQGEPSLRLHFERQDGAGLVLESMLYGSTSIRPRMTDREAQQALTRLVRAVDTAAGARGRGHWEVNRYRCFLQFQLRGAGGQLLEGINLTGSAASHLLQTICVPGNRGHSGRTYERKAVEERFPGTFEQYFASVIAHWQTTRDKRLGLLERHLAALGLTSQVEARSVGDTALQLLVGRTPGKPGSHRPDWVNVADTGFGVSQVLPILVALLAAKPGHLVYLEEPELHLHPRAQSKMAAVLAEAARREVRVVAETHSALLLRGIQTLVAKGELGSEQVRLHWFKRLSDGFTRTYPGELDEQGAYGAKWPEDFDDVLLETEAAYLDAAERRTA